MPMAAKPNRKIRPKQSIGVWIVLLVFFISELLLYTWSRVQCMRLGYGISAAVEKQRELQLLQNNLKVELARLKSPDRIIKIATEQLGLIHPKPEQTIVIP